MNLENTKYDAFISYRHADLDIFVAENLHRQLESFRLPRQVLKERKTEKTRIERVFRDRDELPLASNLADPINEALQNSDYLIVICTPRLLESQWCKKEIETFIKLHGRNRIFAVLAEGEPEESFPDELRFSDEEEINEKGETVIVRRNLEPLAADVRGKDKAEVKKKIKEEILRLAAPMFGLNYDDLKQRHREQKIRRIVATAAIVCGVFLAFGISSSILALQINSQSKKIAEQNKEITAKNDEITEKSAELEQQYLNIQLNYAQTMTDMALTRWNSGDKMLALYLLRSIMPDNLEQPDKPYYAGAQSVLAEIMGVYTDGRTLRQTYTYNVPLGIESMKMSEDGTVLMVKDPSNQFTFWDVQTNEMLDQVKLGDSINSIEMIGNKEIAYNANGFYVYNYRTKKDREIFASYTECVYSSDKSKIVCFDEQELVYYDLNVGAEIWRVDISEYNYYAGLDGCFSDDDMTALIVMKKDDKKYANLFSCATGEIVAQKEISYEYPSFTYGNNTFLIYASTMKSFSSCDTDIICVDANDLSTKWHKELIDQTIRGTICSNYNSQKSWMLYGYNYISDIDLETGNELHRVKQDVYIINMKLTTDGSSLFGLTSEGGLVFYSLGSDEVYVFTDKIDAPSQGIYDVCWGKGGCYVRPNMSNNICKYTYLEGNQRKVIRELEKDGTTELNKDASRALVEIDEILYLVDDNNQVLTSIYPDGEYIMRFDFVGDGLEEFVVRDESVKVYSAVDGSFLREITLTAEMGYFSEFSENGKCIITDCYGDTVYSKMYSITTGELISYTPEYEYTIAGSRSVYSEDSDTIMCYDSNQDEIRLYHNHEDQPYVTKKIPLGYARSFCLSNDGKALAICYGDNAISIYDTKDMRLVNNLFDYGNTSMNLIYEESLNSYILLCGNAGVFLHEDMSDYALVNSFSSYDDKSKLVIQQYGTEIATVPLYTYDMLIGEVDELLKDYEVPEREKGVYTEH